jgi:glutamate synthase (NADPH/NADH) small chain
MCPTGSLSLTDQFLLTSADPTDYLLVPGVDNPEMKENISFVKDDKVALLNFDRVPMRELEGMERIKSFAEVVLGYMQEEARTEATRCVDCALCVTACPDHMHIPEYIAAIADADDKLALKYIYDNNPLPEMCGKVCTRQCETACAMAHKGDPIAIRWLKRYATEQFPDPSIVLEPKITEPNGKTVGIIGGGPAGLSAGYYLALRGFDVTVYEALPRMGGMTYAGIPKYRFPLDSLDKQIDYMKKIGVKMVNNTRIGKDISFTEIKDKYDAVFMGIGFHVPYTIGLDGEDLKGSIQAIDFLREINIGNKVDVGKKVAVIGGGNVAIDAARVARRLGAEVTILYRRRVQDMPADWEEIEGAEDEGVNIVAQGIPLEIIGENGKVKSIKYGMAEMVPDPKGGRPRPQLIENDEHTLELDTIIGAIGQEADYSFLTEEDKKELEIEWGRVVVNEYKQTSIKKIFAGGDNVNRTMDAISAIADGVKAVEGIEKFLLDK